MQQQERSARLGRTGVRQAVSQSKGAVVSYRRGVELGRRSPGEVGRQRQTSGQDSGGQGSQSRRGSGYMQRVWSLVSCSPEGLVHPMMLVLPHAPAGEREREAALIRRTPCPPPAGLLLGTWGRLLSGRAQCWHLVRFAAQLSAAQRRAGLGCWWRWTLIGQDVLGGGRKTQEDVRLLQMRLACGRRESKSGQGRVCQWVQNRVESS